MSEESQAPSMEQNQQQLEDSTAGAPQSKKAAKKEAAKLEKQRRREERSAAEAAAAGGSADDSDPLAANYGDVPLQDLQSKAITGRKWTQICDLTAELKDQEVLVRGRAQTIRAVSKKMAFLVIREKGFTVQCVLSVAPELVSPQMVKFATGLSRESYVDIEGIVSVPMESIKGASQQV